MKFVCRPKSAALRDIGDISISPIFWGHKYLCCIDIGKRNIDPSLKGIQANACARNADKKRIKKYVASHLLPCAIFAEVWNRDSASTVGPNTFSSTDDPTLPTPRSLSLSTRRSESESVLLPDQQRETKASVDATYNAVPLHETNRCTNPAVSIPPDWQCPHRTPSADVIGHMTDTTKNNWLIFLLKSPKHQPRPHQQT